MVEKQFQKKIVSSVYESWLYSLRRIGNLFQIGAATESMFAKIEFSFWNKHVVWKRMI